MPYETHEQTAQARERALHVVQDEGVDSAEHPADEAAFYLRTAARALAAVPGEEIALPRQARSTLIRVESYLLSALSEIERAKARLGEEA